jgi:hypothetical protein
MIWLFMPASLLIAGSSWLPTVAQAQHVCCCHLLLPTLVLLRP